MLQTLKSIFKDKKLRFKFLLTIIILFGIRIGNQIPTYGVNTDYFTSLFAQNGAFSFFNSLTGNSFGRLSLFTLSITPYITASIIVQLLTIAIPRLEELSKDGTTGKDKINKITYILSGILGFAEALAMSIGFGQSGLLKSFTWYNCLIVTILWGSAALLTLYLGKVIDKKGIGNGISLILLFNILSSIPSDFSVIFEKFCLNKPIAFIILNLTITVIICLAVFTFSLVLNNSEKRINVNYSQKIAGRKMSGGANNSIPIKLCLAGVMPIIFASSIMSMPVIISGLIKTDLTGVAGFIINSLNSSNWFKASTPQYSIGYLIYVLLVIFFGYFYVSISFNTREVADNIKKNSGVINGIRPGKPTVEYLDSQIKYMTFIGIVGLLIVATIPMVIASAFGLGSLSLGGTSIIIITSVILDTIKTLETETCVVKSSRFLKF